MFPRSGDNLYFDVFGVLWRTWLRPTIGGGVKLPKGLVSPGARGVSRGGRPGGGEERLRRRALASGDRRSSCPRGGEGLVEAVR